EKVLYLCDGPPKVKCPQIVVFTYPNDRWLSEVRKDRCTYWMPPWALELRLQLAAAVLDYPLAPRSSDDEMEERFWNFGGVASHCLNLDFEAIPEAIHELMGPITRITDRGDLQNLLVGNNDTRHRFLHYRPPRLQRTRITRVPRPPPTNTTRVPKRQRTTSTRVPRRR
ncbi:hypothetical protein PHYSODRAFT_477621, partial [Phytophthora sojae]